MVFSCRTWMYVVFLGSLLGGILCQECIQDACTLPLTQCTYLDYPIFSDHLNVSRNEALANEVFSFSLFPLLESISPACYKAAKIVVCAQLYSSCSNTTASGVTEIKPCVQLCETASQECTAIISQYAPQFMPYFNCTATRADGSSIYSSAPSQCFSLSTIEPLPCFGNQTVISGGCQAYNKSANPNLGGMCAPFMSHEVYVSSPNSSDIQSLVDAGFAPQAAPVMKAYPMLAIGCYRKLASPLCQAALPTCVTVNSSLQAPMPHCLSFCLDVYEECYPSFMAMMPESEYNALLNCSQLHPISKEPLYPTSGSCTNDVFPVNAYESFVLPPFEKCPAVLGRKSKPKDSEAQCSFPCPDKTYTSREFDIISTVMVSCAIVSFILVVILGISHATIPEKRKFPASIQMWLCLALAGMNCAFFFNGYSPKTNNTWCIDPATNANQENSPKCGFQGFFYLFFSLNGICWATVISFTLFYGVVLKRKLELLRDYEIYIHLFCWLVPCIFGFTALGLRAFGFFSVLPFCFIMLADSDEIIHGYPSGMTNDYALYWIPMGVLMLTAIVLLLATAIQIFIVQRAVKGISTQSQTAKAMNRVIFFVIYLSCICFAFLEWRFEIQGKNPAKITEINKKWFTCKIKQELGLPDAGECDTDVPPTGINYGHLMFLGLIASTIGIIAFLLFGTDRENFHTWPLIFKFAKEKNWSEIMLLLKRGKETIARSRNNTINKNAGGRPLSSLLQTSSSSVPSTPTSGSAGVQVELNDVTVTGD